ncbi:MAG: FAD-dependent oxidoreductase, partial [Kiritimatiellae bacterium]|nr:FAD-dependent oxidoreductase [Kiritimatiellia bacterium]
MKNGEKQLDVIVAGGGHAGCEAALIAARMGAETLLITMNEQDVGRLSCNPSIGGIAKSHIVREIDALGGEMARNADYTGIQFKTLNTRKGPAVQANRIQCDKAAYPARMSAILQNQPKLKLLSGMVAQPFVENGVVVGVVMQDGAQLRARCVILTPGTFLNGVIYIGKVQIPGGRWEDPAAVELGEKLREMGFQLERLKTGTPPRLHKDSLNYDAMTPQPGESPPPFLSRQAAAEWHMFHMEQSNCPAPDSPMFHVEHSSSSCLRPWAPGWNQIPCFLTHTTDQTHEIIAKNLNKSALYGGDITGTGVRYCPSIEDKIVKFSSKDSHHVFIEPEGRHSDRIYPNGTSNSLPEE